MLPSLEHHGRLEPPAQMLPGAYCMMPLAVWVLLARSGDTARPVPADPKWPMSKKGAASNLSIFGPSLPTGPPHAWTPSHVCRLEFRRSIHISGVSHIFPAERSEHSSR
jgi:hypothetical protein